MTSNFTKIPANNVELNLYCYLGEALLKTQMVEHALSSSITLKMNPRGTKQQAHEFLKLNQSYTFGRAIKIAIKEKLYNLSLQDALNEFLQQRNWLIHKVICGIEDDFNEGNIKEDLFHKIKSVANCAECLQRKLEYDLIEFCDSQGKNMSHLLKLLKMQDEGIRIRR